MTKKAQRKFEARSRAAQKTFLRIRGKNVKVRTVGIGKWCKQVTPQPTSGEGTWGKEKREKKEGA